MAECTRITPEERERRESFYRMKHRPFNILDMYTWSYPFKMSGLAFGTGATMITIHNTIYRKPWYYGMLVYLYCIIFLKNLKIKMIKFLNL